MVPDFIFLELRSSPSLVRFLVVSARLLHHLLLPLLLTALLWLPPLILLVLQGPIALLALVVVGLAAKVSFLVIVVEAVIQGELVVVVGLKYILIVAKTTTSLTVVGTSIAFLLPVRPTLFLRLML